MQVRTGWHRLLEVLRRRPGLVRGALWLVAGVGLGSGVAAALAVQIWTKMPAPPPPLVKPVDRPEQATRVAAFSEFEVILERNLFHVDVERAEPAPEPATKPVGPPKPQPLVQTPLPLELVGTLGGPDEIALALIRDKRSKKVDVYRVGDRVAGQAIVLKIRRREVELLRGDKREVLRIPDKLPKGSGGGKLRNGNAAPNPPTQPTQVIATRNDEPVALRIESEGEDRYVIDRESFEAVLADLGPLLTQARVVPNFVQGRVQGYKIFAIKPGSLFEQIGLRNGDIIHSVNGVDVNTPERALQLFQQLRAEREFRIEIERGGTPRTLQYTVR